MLQLIDVAKEKHAKDRVNAYWNTYHCQNQIYTSNGRMYAPHCKIHFCTYCCGIRKAQLINKYLPEIKSWKEPYFLMLTAKSVGARHLRAMVENTLRAFKIIVRINSKRSQRGNAKKLKGIKTLECNFNLRARTYNPHLHLLVPDEETANYLLQEWLAL